MGVVDDRTRDGHALALPARQRLAALADQHVEALRMLVHQPDDAADFGRLHDVGIFCQREPRVMLSLRLP